jgi:molybdopterin-containing oxidoreductase family iron-sulfur binding subunit
MKRTRHLNLIGAHGDAAAPRLWRSPEEYAQDPGHEADRRYEFPEGAETWGEDGVSRRNFVRLLGASAAAGTALSCYRPRQKIVPYVRRPPEGTPGTPLHFATASALEGYATGLLVDSHSGRPTKVEGNPDHPDSGGATTSWEQALPLGLYDDNRAKQITHKGKPLAWRSLLGKLAARGDSLAMDGGKGLRFLMEPSSSPLLGDLRMRVQARFPNAKFVSYSAVSRDGAIQGAGLAFGRWLEPRHDLTQADVILSLDADFLNDGPEQIRLHREFSAGRVPGGAADGESGGGKTMNRLYVVEPCLTPTGGMADHRLRVRGSEVVAVAQALVAELAKLAGAEALAPLGALPPAQPTVRQEAHAKWVRVAAQDLHRARGRSLMVAGRRQPAAVHALCHAVNAVLGNLGKTVAFREPLRHDALDGAEPLRELVTEIAAGAVDTLVITAQNPVYGAPADFKFARLLSRVPESIYLGLYEDETARAVTTFIPAAHTLESWGDVRATDGTVSIIQPLISPLWSGTTAADVLAAFAGPGEGDRGAYELLKSLWRKRAVAEGWATEITFEGTWEAWLAKGVVAGTGEPTVDGLTVDGHVMAKKLGGWLDKVPRGEGIEVAFAVDPKVFDGRFANNAILQELPHPITKITWDNAVLLSQTTAHGLGVKTGDVVRVDVDFRSVQGPVYVQPGHADDAVTLTLGYGREGGEAIARDVGFHAGALRLSGSPWFARGARVEKVDQGYRFGITQDHWATEDREPAMAATLAEFQDQHSAFKERLKVRRDPVPTIHEPVDYSKQAYKWGMSIDLSKCSGCNACVVACASENNTPVVGRDNVRIGREMFWIRVDRYYDGEREDPQVVTQPQMCVHCETAPCEYVCPVNATVHSDEGLNEMVYNRCVGTRYCSNNCPYKARRFNFFDYHDQVPAVRKMAANPDVTVRSRGVMEKCTYCVQRIERTRIDARLEGRKIRDGEMVTACQQVCPASAIEFGSLNDAQARVTHAQEDPRTYGLLHELGTRPRTTYLARIRNPNPDLG